MITRAMTNEKLLAKDYEMLEMVTTACASKGGECHPYREFEGMQPSR
jgi:hypothetical protein